MRARSRPLIGKAKHLPNTCPALNYHSLPHLILPVEKKVFKSLVSENIDTAFKTLSVLENQMLEKKETTTTSIVKPSKHDNNSMHSKRNSEE